ncbi:MAG: OmpA family protein [Actinomycetales bacterium]|nr:OmpA family protein [Actinomycetales bacterium]
MAGVVSVAFGVVQAPAAGALSPVVDGVSGPTGLVARVERAHRVSGVLELTVSVANRGTKGVTAVGPLAYLLDGITTGATVLDPLTGRVGTVRCAGDECESGRFPVALAPGQAAAVVLRLDDPGGAVVDVSLGVFQPVTGVAVEGAPPATAAGEQLLPRKADLLPRTKKDGARASGKERVDLDTDVLFAFGSAKLSGKAGKAIDAAVEVLKAQPKRKLAVYGHTDGVGSDAANLALSKKRAEAVRAALAKKLGSGWSFEVKGFGETKPIAAEKTDKGQDYPAGRALNRRVELRLLG